MTKKAKEWADTLKSAPMQPEHLLREDREKYHLYQVQGSGGKWTFTCKSVNCQLPHLIIGAKGYVEDKANAHTEWCGTRSAPMSWR